jgi:hypothetical protein
MLAKTAPHRPPLAPAGIPATAPADGTVDQLRAMAVDRSLRLLPVGPELSRVTDPGGRVIGHLQLVAEAQGVRYRVRRYHATVRAFLDLGDFWSPADALDCLRFAR